MALDVIDLTEGNTVPLGSASIKVEPQYACSKEKNSPVSLNCFRFKKRKLHISSDTENESKRMREGENHETDDESTSSDDVEVIDPRSCDASLLPSDSVASMSQYNVEMDEVQLVGTKNHLRLPHMRQHCTEFPMQIDCTVYCDGCYCFVCDVQANRCQFWQTHCKATDQGPTAPRWRTVRQQVQAKGLSVLTENGLLSSPIVRIFSLVARILGRTAPFPPHDNLAHWDHTLTKCRHCGWFNQFDHQNFNPRYRLGPIGSSDWCRACGRVASENDFGKEQCRPFAPRPGDVLLWTRIMNFSLRAHDPRKMEEYKSRWKEYEGSDGWVFDDSAMQAELFRHRLSTRPTLANLLNCIPPIDNDQIPIDDNYRNRHDIEKTSFFETDAVLMEKMEDVLLLRELLRCDATRGENWPASDSCNLAVDLTARWDKATNKGTITVHVFGRKYNRPLKIYTTKHDFFVGSY